MAAIEYIRMMKWVVKKMAHSRRAAKTGQYTVGQYVWAIPEGDWLN